MSRITITELPEAFQELLQEAKETDTPLTITKEEQPFAIVYLATYLATKRESRPAPGFRKDSGQILGDIVSPPEQPWEVLQ